MRPAVLLHVVFARKSLIALRAEGILLSGVLLGMPGSVARRGEIIGAVVLLGERARVLILFAGQLRG